MKMQKRIYITSTFLRKNCRKKKKKKVKKNLSALNLLLTTISLSLTPRHRTSPLCPHVHNGSSGMIFSRNFNLYPPSRFYCRRHSLHLSRRRNMLRDFLNYSHHYRTGSHASVSAVAPPAIRRLIALVLLLVTIFCSCFLLYRAAESIGFKIPAPYSYRHSLFPYDSAELSSDHSMPLDSEKYKLENVLNDASMPDKTVILTTLNDAWADPNSVVDLFLESFRIGEHTRGLLNHLVIITLDQKAFSRCLLVHAHCFPLVTEGANFSGEAYFMSPEYLKMMWRRIQFLTSILEMGFNFVFTDADIMWFRDPFKHFNHDADFQIACDHFSGRSGDVDNKPNGGFKFVRSNNRSIMFYKYWYAAKDLYPGLHDQDVLNKIKNHTYVRDIGLRMWFLNTAYFGGFCEPSEDLNQVCTMHANCCFGLDTKLHDLRILIQDWKEYMSLPPTHKISSVLTWRVPQNCSLDALLHQDAPKKDLQQTKDDEMSE